LYIFNNVNFKITTTVKNEDSFPDA